MTLVTPTVRGWVLIIAALVSVAIALVNIGLATALAASALTGMVLSSFILAFFSMYKLKLERRANLDGLQNNSVNLPVTIKNLSWRFRQAMVVKEKCAFIPGGVLAIAIPPLSPNEEIILPRTCNAAKRGHFKLGKLSLIGGDPAGLFRRCQNYNIPAEIMIAPEITHLSNLPVTGSSRH
ncbi:MAG: hypothetical protein GY750_19010 [Lentisphaerae bacterium]|nr:hypothetical protein [Lentisphaerota bacterium]MCP4103489.1 hypothetical protein [Lentisphaerota bacterium]